MCCDFRVATEKAIIGLTETSLGIIPGAGGIRRLSNLIGISKAKYWIYTAQKFTAENAYNDGLIDFIAKEQELLGVTLEVSQEILEYAPLAIKASKEVLIGSFNELDIFEKIQKEAYLKVIDTQDKQEAIKAFLEKRKPNWKNK